MPRLTAPTLLATMLAALLAGTLSACQLPGASSMNTDPAEHSIELKERPNPQRAYRIVMTIADAPGPFVPDPGSTQHDIANLEACGRINHNTGMIFHINAHPQFEWKQISNTEYEGTVYADQMVDEDYFGRGVCHWKLTFANGSLSATGAENETRFQPTIEAYEIAAGKTVTWYFWKGYYPRAKSANFSESGQKNLDSVPTDKRSEFFTITLAAKEV